MTDQEARDEREALIAEAKDLVAYHLREQEFDPRHRDRTPAEQAKLIERLISALTRKHPESEWEWGTALRTPAGELWDPYVHPSRAAAEQAIATDNPEDRAPDELVLVRRTPGTTAGPWEPVDVTPGEETDNVGG